jgi:TPM domain
MRLARLFAVVLTILTSGLLLSTPAGAQPAPRLTDHITDTTGALTASGRAAVSSAIDRLSHDRHIQLWVVYVDNFNRFKPDNWAGQTRSATGLGDHDALLAVATNTKTYTLTGPPKAQGITENELNTLRNSKIAPAVSAKDWSGAAVAAADGLNASASAPRPDWLPIAIGVAVAVVVLLVLFLIFRARRRRRARRVDAGGGQASVESGDALSIADARVRQISDYAAKYQKGIGAEAKSKLEEAKRQLAAAHGRQASNASEAIAYANWASTLAAQAQTLANADVLAAHRTPGRRGTASTR